MMKFSGKRLLTLLIAFALTLFGALPGLSEASPPEESGERWEEIAASGLRIFLPEGASALEIDAAAAKSGYTARFALGDGYLGVGVWMVAADYAYEDEFAYSVETYGEAHVRGVRVNGLNMIRCEDAATRSLMQLYPDGAGRVFFAVGTPCDGGLFRALVQTIFQTMGFAADDGADA